MCERRRPIRGNGPAQRRSRSPEWQRESERLGLLFTGVALVVLLLSGFATYELVRRSLRNWFRPNYPYVYATFRRAMLARLPALVGDIETTVEHESEGQRRQAPRRCPKGGGW